MDTRGFNEKDIMSSLDGIAEAISAGGGGGSSLPEVNSDDNGKVLTVVNGAWDKATASGGGGEFIINLTSETSLIVGESTSLEIDKTFDEIAQAFETGKIVFCSITTPDEEDCFTRISFSNSIEYEDQGETFQGLIFQTIVSYSTEIYVYHVEVWNDGVTNVVKNKYVFSN